MSFMGRSMPCKLPSVGSASSNSLPWAEFCPRSSMRTTACQMSEAVYTAFEHLRPASKTRPWKMTGRGSIRRLEIFGYQFCSMIGTALCPFGFGATGTQAYL